MIVWSKSRLKTFRECPMRYKFGYIDKIPKEEVEALKKGIILHEFFNKFYDNYKENIMESIIKTTEQLEVPEDFQNKYSEHVKSFIDLNKKNIDKPLMREKRFYYDNWLGIIDRIDNINGKITVIDYKTSSGRDLTSYLDELLLYAFLVQKNTDLKVDAVAIFFTANNKFISKDVTQEEIQKNYDDLCLEAEIYEDKIEHDEFDYSPGYYCRWCPYQKICKVKTGYK